MKTDTVTIIGMTPEGEVFRPRDWHHRLAGLAGNFTKQNKIQYNSLVTPTWVNCEDVPGLLVNKALEETDPTMYNFIKKFVLDNDLRVKYTDAEEVNERPSRNVGSSKEWDSASVYDI